MAKDVLPHLTVIEGGKKSPILAEYGDSTDEQLKNIGLVHFSARDYPEASKYFLAINTDEARFLAELCSVLGNPDLEQDFYRSSLLNMIVNIIRQFEGVDARDLIPFSLRNNLDSLIAALSTDLAALPQHDIPLPNTCNENNSKEIITSLRTVLRELSPNIRIIDED